VSNNGASSEQPMTVEGLVEAVNERGIRVHGEWLNVSQFRPVPLPEQGTLVRVEVRSNGFIKSLEVIKTVAESPTPAVLSDKDERITRLAVLKAAAGFGASRPDLKSADVLAIADKWLAWVNSMKGTGA
jgi:hypothetical protein